MGKTAPHGLQKLLNVRPHKNFHHKSPTGHQVLASYLVGGNAQFQRTGLIGKTGARSSGGHIADNKVKRAKRGKRGFKCRGGGVNIGLKEGNLRRKLGADLIRTIRGVGYLVPREAA